MKPENKELLLRDLCARLPYRPIVRVLNGNGVIRNVPLSSGNIAYVEKLEKDWWTECKPYLRSMSSMTKEERNEYHSYCDYYYGKYFDTVESIDWLNKKMFAYRTINGKDMFELGLALKASEGMYKF